MGMEPTISTHSVMTHWRCSRCYSEQGVKPDERVKQCLCGVVGKLMLRLTAIEAKQIKRAARRNRR